MVVKVIQVLMCCSKVIMGRRWQFILLFVVHSESAATPLMRRGEKRRREGEMKEKKEEIS